MVLLTLLSTLWLYCIIGEWLHWLWLDSLLKGEWQFDTIITMVRLFCKQFYRLYYIYILIPNHAAHFAILRLTIISGLNGWINGWWNSLTLFHWVVRVFLLSVYHYMFNV